MEIETETDEMCTAPPPEVCNAAETELEKLREPNERRLRETPPRRRYIKLAIAFLFLLVVVLTLVLTDAKKNFTEFMEWVDENKFEGALAFVAVFSVSEGAVLHCSRAWLLKGSTRF